MTLSDPKYPFLYILRLLFFFPNSLLFFLRLQTDIFETSPHDVALLEKEALLCRFPKRLVPPNKMRGKTPNFDKKALLCC